MHVDWAITTMCRSAAQACHYALKCLKMGAPWTYFDAFTNSLRFLYCSQGYTHFHEEAYSTFETWQTEQCGVIDAVKDVKKLLEPWRGPVSFFHAEGATQRNSVYHLQVVRFACPGQSDLRSGFRAWCHRMACVRSLKTQFLAGEAGR